MDGVHFINIEFFLALIVSLFTGILKFLGIIASSPGEPGIFSSIGDLWGIFTILSTLVSLALAGVIVYSASLAKKVAATEKEKYGKILLPEAKAEGEGNPRWKHVEELAESMNQNDWRQAIIEADILLDEMLATQGYQAPGVGEKLKMIERSDFASLDDAWEAHKVRNQIAHAGSTFILSKDLANRTIAKYRKVFEEFYLV